MGRIVNRFNILVAEKGVRDGLHYKLRHVALETGLSKNVMTGYSNGLTRRFDYPTLLSLCNWLECDIGDLLAIAEDDGRWRWRHGHVGVRR